MKKKSILIALAILFVFIAVIPVSYTFAYFTARDEATGEAVVDLTWNTILTEDIPNGKDKHITIENIGETPVIVRVNVFGGEFATISPEEEEDWQEGDGGWWYYTKVLEPTAKTTQLIVEVNNAPANYDFNIVVVHESSRVVYQYDVDSNTTAVVTPDGWDSDIVPTIVPES